MAANWRSAVTGAGALFQAEADRPQSLDTHHQSLEDWPCVEASITRGSHPRRVAQTALFGPELPVNTCQLQRCKVPR